MAVSFLTARKDRYLLVLADLVALFLALTAALAVRYDGGLSGAIFSLHLFPFSVISAFSILAYYIAGLYERGAMYDLRKAVSRLLNAEIAVALAAIAFFYFDPNPAITPKTTLTLYIVFSYVLVLMVRSLYAELILPNRQPLRALLIADGREADELASAGDAVHRIGIRFAERLSPADAAQGSRLQESIARHNPAVIVVDNGHPATAKIMPVLYEFIFSRKRFVDVQALYEEVFERVPLSLVRYEWFLEHASSYRSLAYEIIRRLVEIATVLILLVPTVILIPFVAVAVKLEDRGPVFIMQRRIGRSGRVVMLPKFRSMRGSDAGKWLEQNDSRVTRVGYFLRKTRIDELPQLFAVLKGDLSLIGPRPDIENLGQYLEGQLPFYRIRNLVAPGLSGWAQIKQDLPPQSVEENRMRLSYDFYYVKNRSLALDLAIALRTVAILLSRKGM